MSSSHNLFKGNSKAEPIDLTVPEPLRSCLLVRSESSSSSSASPASTNSTSSSSFTFESMHTEKKEIKVAKAAVDELIEDLNIHIDKEFIAQFALARAASYENDFRLRCIADKKEDGSIVSSAKAGINKIMRNATAQSFYEIAGAFGSLVALKHLDRIRNAEENHVIAYGNSYRIDDPFATAIQVNQALNEINKENYQKKLNDKGEIDFFRSMLNDHIYEISTTFEHASKHIIAYDLFLIASMFAENLVTIPEAYASSYFEEIFLTASFKLGGELVKWAQESNYSLPQKYHPVSSISFRPR